MKILLVEDDFSLAEVLTEALNDYGYVVDVAIDGEKGWYQATEDNYGIILLDWMLPKLDGITVCKRLRETSYTVPILMMTARDGSTDKVMGLDAGADDYVVKPIDLAELLARIRALLRRGPSTMMPVLTWGDIQLNPSNHEVFYQKQEINLTPKEFSLLELFLRSGRQVLSRRMILNQLWDFEDQPEEEAVKAHIKLLRRKFSLAGVPTDPIKTIRGIGYCLKKLN
ncbi:Response regulator MprA [Acaryochloris thomasi RCC1774]|uniref:Response regulator MprA n=1 Tax=Acaryochloris thomasi RCC1774 TaxID=1764569 RepID=A0A2W1JYD2_9CYAN|nr:response regulator transcription factor [Acaryochloris thomasi]PZD73571.1 Response regulator MprA [Acaryochloris thomasi RCC1774]